MSTEKIGIQHRARKAVLYVRQSSAHHVTHNRESRALQYAMRERAHEPVPESKVNDPLTAEQPVGHALDVHLHREEHERRRDRSRPDEGAAGGQEKALEALDGLFSREPGLGACFDRRQQIGARRNEQHDDRRSDESAVSGAILPCLVPKPVGVDREFRKPTAACSRQPPPKPAIGSLACFRRRFLAHHRELARKRFMDGTVLCAASASNWLACRSQAGTRRRPRRQGIPPLVHDDPELSGARFDTVTYCLPNRPSSPDAGSRSGRPRSRAVLPNLRGCHSHPRML